jgi:hypothetical protein
MAKTVPSTFSGPGIIQFGTAEDIDGEDYLSVVQAEHHIWSRIGARLCGLILDPTFTTTSATLTQTTTSSSRNLSGWTGVVAPRRRVLSSGTHYYALTVEIIGANCDVTVSFIDDPDPGAGTAYTATASVVGATVSNATATVLVPVTNDVYLCTIEAKTNSGGTATVAQVNIYESIDPSSYYP